MRPVLRWHSRPGDVTSDNRDAIAHLELQHARFYLLADGSSRYPYSGELARALLALITQSISDLPPAQLSQPQLPEALIDIITKSRQTLQKHYPVAACSYLILCLLDDSVFSLHEGDCCLGRIEAGGKIAWLSTVHCASNWLGNLNHAEIARQPLRHRLTRCFSARRPSQPEVNQWPADQGQHWLLASDGFWAGLSLDEQLAFMQTGDLLSPSSDDITYLSITNRTQ